MNLFTRNSLYYHPLKYILFVLKHPVYSNTNMEVIKHCEISQRAVTLNSSREWVFGI